MDNSFELLHKLDSSNAAKDDSNAIMTYKDKSIYNLLQRSRKVRITNAYFLVAVLIRKLHALHNSEVLNTSSSYHYFKIVLFCSRLMAVWSCRTLRKEPSSRKLGLVQIGWVGGERESSPWREISCTITKLRYACGVTDVSMQCVWLHCNLYSCVMRWHLVNVLCCPCRKLTRALSLELSTSEVLQLRRKKWKEVNTS